MSDPMPFTGAVLTGGASTRMGQDKATLVVDGVSMGARVVAALRDAGATDVLAVGGQGIEGVRLVADGEGVGPLAGIRGALRAAESDVIVVLACDMPDVSPVGIAAVVAGLASDPAALVAVPMVDGRPEPLHAAWRREAMASFPPGESAVHAVLAALQVVEVHGLDPAWLRNVNEPGDL